MKYDRVPILFVLVLGACAPRVRPLTGVERPPSALPRYELAPTFRQVTFKWELEDEGMVMRGDGAVRTAPPDSARVDFFLGAGLGSGFATMVGDKLRVPTGMIAPKSMIPPMPLLWASLGRLALPPLPDTIVRVSGDTVRAQFGHPAAWRVTGLGTQLLRLERIEHGRIVEFVEREPGRRARYESPGHRSLVLDVQRDQTVPPFDASIWNVP